jgi:chemotaxis signal transduction protein
MKLGNGSSHDRSGAAPAEVGASSLISALECRVGRAPLAIPVAAVAQIIEYQTSPLPLARRWVAGMGLHDGRLVLTIGLVPAGAGAGVGLRPVKAVLLQVPGSEVGWALEISEVLVFVRATSIERGRAVSSRGDLPPWIGRVTTEDGRSIGWIDVPAMVGALTSVEEGGA